MLWHNEVMEILFIKFPSCNVLLKEEIVLFLPYNQGGKIRVETYDLYLFQRC
jgi:hypothetical protein